MRAAQHRNTWETYGSAWAQTDPRTRTALLVQCLDPGCVYSDPHTQTIGHDALSAYMAELQSTVPGLGFVVTAYQCHHDRSLAHWNMTDGGGTVLMPGVSVGWYGADGKLVQMTGFF